MAEGLLDVDEWRVEVASEWFERSSTATTVRVYLLSPASREDRTAVQLRDELQTRVQQAAELGEMTLSLTDAESARTASNYLRAARFVDVTFGVPGCPETSPPPPTPSTPPNPPPPSPPIPSPLTPFPPVAPPPMTVCMTFQLLDDFGDGWSDDLKLRMTPLGVEALGVEAERSMSFADGTVVDETVCLSTIGCYVVLLGTEANSGDGEASWWLRGCGANSRIYLEGQAARVCVAVDTSGASCEILTDPSMPPRPPPSPLPAPPPSTPSPTPPLMPSPPPVPNVMASSYDVTVHTLQLTTSSSLDAASAAAQVATVLLGLVECTAPQCLFEVVVHPCSTIAAASCAGPAELCFYDPACEDATHADHADGIECNAGGVSQSCRFCGFGAFVDCLDSTSSDEEEAASGESSDGQRRQLSEQSEQLITATFTFLEGLQDAAAKEASFGALESLATTDAAGLSTLLSLPITSVALEATHLANVDASTLFDPPSPPPSPELPPPTTPPLRLALPPPSSPPSVPPSPLNPGEVEQYGLEISLSGSEVVVPPPFPGLPPAVPRDAPQLPPPPPVLPESPSMPPLPPSPVAPPQPAGPGPRQPPPAPTSPFTPQHDELEVGSGSGSGTLQLVPSPLLPPFFPPPATQPPEYACSTVPAGVCAGPSEPCVYDPACADPSSPDHAGGLGCNAGGQGQFCRFCGFGPFVPCPGPAPPAVPPSVPTLGELTDTDSSALSLQESLAAEEFALRLLVSVIFGCGVIFTISVFVYFRMLACKARREQKKEKAKYRSDEEHLTRAFASSADISADPSRWSNNERDSTDGRCQWGMSGVSGAEPWPDLLARPAHNTQGSSSLSDTSEVSLRGEASLAGERSTALRRMSTELHPVPLIRWTDVSLTGVPGREAPEVAATDVDEDNSILRKSGEFGEYRVNRRRFPERQLMVLATGDSYVATVKSMRRVATVKSMRRVYMLHSIETATTPDALRRVLLEAAELRKLQHQSLLHIFAVVTDQPCGEVGLLSELTAGSLATVLEHPPLQLTWANGLLAIATDVAVGLTYLHSRSLHHGRLFLFNVLLTSKWRAKLSEAALEQYLNASHGGLGDTGGYDLLPSSHGAHGGQIKSSSVLYLPPEKCSGQLAVAQRRRLAEVSAASEREAAGKTTRGRAVSLAAGGRRGSGAGPLGRCKSIGGGAAPAASPSAASVGKAEALLGAEGAAAAAAARAASEQAKRLADAKAAAEFAEQRGDAWAFGCLLCSLAIHQKRDKEKAKALRLQRMESRKHARRENSVGSKLNLQVPGSSMRNMVGHVVNDAEAPLSVLDVRRSSTSSSADAPQRRDNLMSKLAAMTPGHRDDEAEEKREQAARKLRAQSKERREASRRSREASRTSRETRRHTRRDHDDLDGWDHDEEHLKEKPGRQVMRRGSQTWRKVRSMNGASGRFQEEFAATAQAAAAMVARRSSRQEPEPEPEPEDEAEPDPPVASPPPSPPSLADMAAGAAAPTGAAAPALTAQPTRPSASALNMPSARKMCGPSTYRRIAAAAVAKEKGTTEAAVCTSRVLNRLSSATAGGLTTGRSTSFEEMAETTTTTPYVLMLRVCQGLVSPLDGVTVQSCPRPLLKLAAQCCELKAEKRPELSAIVELLHGSILTAVNSSGGTTAGALRPSQPLCGWRDAAEAAMPSRPHDGYGSGADASGGERQGSCARASCSRFNRVFGRASTTAPAAVPEAVAAAEEPSTAPEERVAAHALPAPVSQATRRRNSHVASSLAAKGAPR